MYEFSTTFLIETFIEIITDSHAIVKKKRSLIPCTICPVFPNTNILQNYCDCCNQDTNIDTIYPSPHFTCTHLYDFYFLQLFCKSKIILKREVKEELMKCHGQGMGELYQTTSIPFLSPPMSLHEVFMTMSFPASSALLFPSSYSLAVLISLASLLFTKPAKSFLMSRSLQAPLSRISRSLKHSQGCLPHFRSAQMEPPQVSPSHFFYILHHSPPLLSYNLINAFDKYLLDE